MSIGWGHIVPGRSLAQGDLSDRGTDLAVQNPYAIPLLGGERVHGLEASNKSFSIASIRPVQKPPIRIIQAAASAMAFGFSA
jgi:hypothetical protein